jgi:hypothetical protein
MCEDEASAAVLLASLDPPQSTVLDDPLTRPDIRYRFKSHEQPYKQVLTILRKTYRHEKRARRLALCGAHATIWHSPSTDTVAVRSFHCGLRACPRCRETHAARTRDKLLRFTKLVPLNELSMITLTIRSTSAPLDVQLDNLYKAFRKLRKSNVWKEARPSGYAVLEITLNDETRQWHPHLHLLARARYMEQRRLSDAWGLCTGGSRMVDIRRVNARAVEACHRYLTDYLTKPPSDTVLSSGPLLLAWIDALMNRKVLLRFGKPELADEAEKPQDPEDWALIGTINGLLAGLARHDRRASYWLTRIRTGPVKEQRDLDAGIDYRYVPGIVTTPGDTFY